MSPARKPVWRSRDADLLSPDASELPCVGMIDVLTAPTSELMVRVSVVSGVTVNACVENTTSAVCPAVRRSSKSSTFEARARDARRLDVGRHPSSARDRARRRALLRTGTRERAAAPTSGPRARRARERRTQRERSAASGFRAALRARQAHALGAARIDERSPAAALGAAAHELARSARSRPAAARATKAARNGTQPWLT